jgi:hypothetical protein
MHIPKLYGQPRIDRCHSCGSQSTAKNRQQVPVCNQHRDEVLDLKCACGSWLEIRNGKYGAYCHCINCGNINLRNALSINAVEPKKHAKDRGNSSTASREITVNSDDPAYFSD